MAEVGLEDGGREAGGEGDTHKGNPSRDRHAEHGRTDDQHGSERDDRPAGGTESAARRNGEHRRRHDRAGDHERDGGQEVCRRARGDRHRQRGEELVGAMATRSEHGTGTGHQHGPGKENTHQDLIDVFGSQVDAFADDDQASDYDQQAEPDQCRGMQVQ